MKKQGTNKNVKMTFGVYLVLIVVVVTAFMVSFAISTDYCKKEVDEKLHRVTSYIQNQCTVYDDTTSEDVAKSLVNLIDKAHELRKSLHLATGDVAEHLAESCENMRITGVIVTNTDGSVAYQYITDNLTTEFWKTYLTRFTNIVGIQYKSYSARLTLENNDFADYALLSAGEGYGVILCYSVQDLSNAVTTQLSVKNLLNDFDFERKGVVAVADGNRIVASNDESLIGKYAYDCEVIGNIIADSSQGKTKVVSVGEKSYHAHTDRTKSYYIYAYLPDDVIFMQRTLVMAYCAVVIVAFVLIYLIVAQIHTSARKREQRAAEMRYQDELNDLANKAIRANQVKTEFLRRMSHDIRTPINGIRGMIKIGNYYADDLDKQQECRDKIWTASGYLLALVNNVLDMSKLDSTEVTWQDENFEMTKLLDDMSGLMRLHASENGIDFIAEKQEIKHNDLYGAAVLIKRMLGNLIGNAVKYNRDGGAVWFSCKEIAFNGVSAAFEFVVRDNGIGMSEDFQKIMYEPFTQEHADNNDTAAGVGLGLSIVKSIVDHLNGTIEIDSKLGEGTSFRVVIPIEVRKHTDAETKPELPREQNVGTDAPLKGMRVLVAEDNELNMEITRFVLETAGAEVLTATDGKKTLDLFENSEIGSVDVILMDVMMPTMDGLQAAKEIRALPRSDAQSVAIIAVTANAFSDDIRQAIAVGMNEHIGKPVDSDRLVEMLLKYKKSK